MGELITMELRVYRRRKERTDDTAESTFSTAELAKMLAVSPRTLAKAIKEVKARPVERRDGEKYWPPAVINKLGHYLNQTLGEWTFFYGRWQRRKEGK